MMNKQEIEKAISLLKSDIGVLDNYLKKHPHLEEDRCVENQLIKDMEFTISALEHQLTNGWIPVSERLPKCEEEVFVLTEKGTRTTAMYEDGTMPDEDSAWNWTDINYNYDEVTDTNYIPEGWWEYRHFNPDDVYNNTIDEKVIAWQPLPEPYKEVSE